MSDGTGWDFRDEQELQISNRYEEHGYVIEKADQNCLEAMKVDVENAYFDFIDTKKGSRASLEDAHHVISNDESNNLRLHVIQRISQDVSFQKNYYNAAKKIIDLLCGNELAMQKRPGLSINLPKNEKDILPIHADTWNGVSPFELNIWIPFVDCYNSMCLYILTRDKYMSRVERSKGLLRLNSDELFDELRNDLTWIPIKYGEILAFDQSLPHGYSLNKESVSHWSMNCRFKGLHTPYWDKKLGEYFMPITVKKCTRLGMNYKHPKNWI